MKNQLSFIQTLLLNTKDTKDRFSNCNGISETTTFFVKKSKIKKKCLNDACDFAYSAGTAEI